MRSITGCCLVAPKGKTLTAPTQCFNKSKSRFSSLTVTVMVTHDEWSCKLARSPEMSDILPPAKVDAFIITITIC